MGANLKKIIFYGNHPYLQAVVCTLCQTCLLGCTSITVKGLTVDKRVQSKCRTNLPKSYLQTYLGRTYDTLLRVTLSYMIRLCLVGVFLKSQPCKLENIGS